MKHVKGIGGIFFRSEKHKELAVWYTEHFGINDAQSETPWMTEAGATVFSPFKEDTNYFGSTTQMFMVNFRINDLDGFVEKLKAAGVKIDDNRMEESYGKFAWVYDPEGNKIELWEPAK
jgi:glyoxylase I family protein